jgi:hypothetical protein
MYFLFFTFSRLDIVNQEHYLYLMIRLFYFEINYGYGNMPEVSFLIFFPRLRTRLGKANNR